ncbi:HlyD family secretion protein [Massilia sp. H-1]|nr:HlyD family secretion protein [Massilia sp. H-1]
MLHLENGFITAFATQVGESISIDQHLAALTPGNFDTNKSEVPVEAHLFVTSKDSGFVEKGQKILIRYQAYPYQKFGLFHGTITAISNTPFAPHELPSSLASTVLSKNAVGNNTSESLFRIRVELDAQKIEVHGKLIGIRPGMTLDADILLEDKRIWEWILEPLIAVARR